MTNPDNDAQRLVTNAYRWILGREPDPEGLAYHIALVESGGIDQPGLRHSFLSSPEFEARNGAASISQALDGLMRQPPADIEHEVDADTLKKLADRVREQWTILGETEPHWSVLTNEAFRQTRLNDASLAEFYRSGANEANLLEIFEARTGTMTGRGTCVELGCGVGRITRFLSERFERVIAIDISPGNLALCRAYMDEQGIENVETMQISGIEDLGALPDHDLFFSIIVMQHNPPPIQKAILRTILPKSGAALFQTPATMPGYGFRASDHLAGDMRVMDMHGLPRPVVLGEIKQAGLQIRDLCPDGFTGHPGSFTYFATRD